jgi:uncharacterized protein (DUF58 family)
VKQRGLPRVYPTSGLAGLIFVLGATWYAAASQSNAAAYLLLFALSAVFLVSIPHALLNVAGLKATAESITPIFAGDEVSLPVEIVNQSGIAGHGLRLRMSNSDSEAERIDHIPAGKATRATLRFIAPKRGEYEIGSLSLESLYPLGFFRSSQVQAGPQRYLVYPRPAGDSNLPVDRTRLARSTPQHEFGEGDDFAGVRPYILGESQRHIDWKAVARGQKLMTKQFSAEASGLLCFDFAAVPFSDTEDRLSQIALWVIEAERARRPYGLRLPAEEIAPSLGQAHFHQCLRALALFK